MNKQPSINNYDHTDNINSPSDQIKPSGNTPGIYYPDDYNIPDREAKTWCSYMEREFRASRNLTAEQNGTNTDDSEQSIKDETSADELLQSK